MLGSGLSNSGTINYESRYNFNLRIKNNPLHVRGNQCFPFIIGAFNSKYADWILIIKHYSYMQKEILRDSIRKFKHCD